MTRARAVAEASKFDRSSSDEVGMLLRVLVATVRDGTVAEIGAGTGVGTAWMVSGLADGARLVTVELDEARAASVAELFTTDRRVRVIAGDWRPIAAYGPFDLLFADGGGAKEADLHALLRPGGIVVLDDFTDPSDWDGSFATHGDELRERWLGDTRFAATIVGVGHATVDRTRRAQALVAVRL